MPAAVSELGVPRLAVSSAVAFLSLQRIGLHPRRSPPRRRSWVVDINNKSPDLGSFLASSVNTIRFTGGSGAETVKAESDWDGSVATGHVAVNKPLDFYGSYGNDVFTGGDAPDLLDGGPDNDIIHGAKGSDTMYGGSGDDVFYVETNDAPMYMYGGDGQDQFHTSNGIADYIDGGAGSDTATDRDTSNPADTVVNVETL